MHDHMEAKGAIKGPDFLVVALLEKIDDTGLLGEAHLYKR